MWKGGSNTAADICDVEQQTYVIRLTGIVQGVGFRPYVYRVASLFGIHGFVRNDIEGVYLEVSGLRSVLKKFYLYLIENIPKEAVLISHTFEQKEYYPFESFSIQESHRSIVKNNALIAPDFAMCQKCKEELHDSKNRRFQYPFITCTDCGPRYSILQALPFDRDNTAMKNFVLCQNCHHEFLTPDDRRFYSQTNSCKSCGIHIKLYTKDKEQIVGDDSSLIKHVVEALKEGQIVAVKGIGGFLLICDATNKQSIECLRKRKHRPSKPFAVLYPNIEWIENDYYLCQEERTLLESEIAPIVLLRQKKNNADIALDQIAPQLKKTGVFLPYAPLLELIAHGINTPLVATSANVSGSNLIYSNEKALSELPTIADYILTHNRDITIPQDDSVTQFSTETKTKIVLRTARGLSPVYFSNPNAPLNAIAYGASQKSSVSIASGNQIYMSQYLGNTEDYDSQESYKEVSFKIGSILNIEPTISVCDKHPNYFSTTFAQQISEKTELPLIRIQHHKAHLYAILGEYKLIDDSLLGIIWDGTGLGDDGNIWGGEFFIYKNREIERAFHLEYVPSILGDKMAKEPRISALSFSQGYLDELLLPLFTQTEWKLFNEISKQEQLKTSSMGRLFDAVAAILGLKPKQSYEGEAALLLEDLASQYRLQYPDFDEVYSYDVLGENISFKSMLLEIHNDLKNNQSSLKIAFKFHLTLVNLVDSIAKKTGLKKIAFSGGVFQNALLVDLLKIYLSDKYTLYFHQRISANDENISFGQIIALSNQ